MKSSRCASVLLLASVVAASVGLATPACAGPSPGPVISGGDSDGNTIPLLRGLGTTPAWQGQGGAAGDEYGYCVATAGDVNGDGYSDLIVGARHYSNGHTYEGAAFLYLGSAEGLASTPAWSVESNQSGAALGVCVAPAGDVNNDGYDDVIIGADIYDLGQFDEGCAFVYLGTPTGLAATPVWTGQADQSGAQYGLSVATAGDVNGDGYDDVLVGAPFFDQSGSDAGRAFLYYGTPTGVSPTPAWAMGSNQANARYGRSVASAGDVNGDGYADVIIGAERFDGISTDCGRAWVYLGSAAGLSSTAVWQRDGDLTGDHLGWCVATAGDVDGDGYADVAIGAPEADGPMGIVDEGRVYVHRGAAYGIVNAYYQIYAGGQASAHFGTSVATAGDTNGDALADLVVGAWGYDMGQIDEGRVYVYEGPLVGIYTEPVWMDEIDQAGARYGSSVATAGDVNGDGFGDVVIGTWGYDTPASNAGGAWVFEGSADGLSDLLGWTIVGDQALQQLGQALSAVGDLNGDGHGDVAIAAPYRDEIAGVDLGRVWVHHGAPRGPGASPDWTCTGEQAGSCFGMAVAPAGDVNGDGYSDLLVGASGFDLPGGESHGKVYLYAGSAAGLSPAPVWTAVGEQAQMRLGGEIAGAGDVNGDGYADVIFGSSSFTNPEFFEGKVLLYLGSATGLGGAPAWEVEGNLPSHSLGVSVATAGDVNGDGYSDVIVGAYGYAYVYLGSPAGLAQTPVWTGSLGQVGDSFGNSVSTAGDIDGDGFDDIIVGAPNYDHPGYPENTGAVAVYRGSPAGPEANPDWFSWGAQAAMHLGRRVGTAGDVNGDGYADFGASAPDWKVSGAEVGYAFVKFGAASGPSGFPEWFHEGTQGIEHLGSALACAGDTNGDGYDDLLLGSPIYTVAGTRAAEGRVQMFMGNDRNTAYGGLPLIPRHQQPATQAPIDLLGRSASLDGFCLAALGRSAAGRARVRLEWQAAEFGTPLGPLVIASGPWTLTSMPVLGVGSQVDLAATVTGFGEDTPCHWRLRMGCRSPFFPVTPWMSMSRSVPSQQQLRTGRTFSAVEAAPAGAAGGIRLAAPQPNPFGDRTRLAYTLQAPSAIRLSVHDVAGRRVRVLVDGPQERGQHVIDWDGRDDGGRPVARGLYYVRANDESRTRAVKLVVVP